ncbi:MAG: TolC family protein [Acidobacteria bacterium]|nr:TolC family protein [Acidobacteriota bacterium]
MNKILAAAAAAVLLGAAAGVHAQQPPTSSPHGAPDAPTRLQQTPETPSFEVVGGIADPHLASLLQEVLERNPDVAALAASARAAAEKAPQVKALPDPTASLTAYLLTPETRVGPQYAMVSLSQKFPWFGKLSLKEQAALAGAAAARAGVEARRLSLVTEVRRLAYELAFVAAETTEVTKDRSTLTHYEELARVRYATGAGLEQGVIKIQAEITRDDTRLLDIGTRRSSLEARLNALRDRPDGTPLPKFTLPAPSQPKLVTAVLRSTALARRPELSEADARIAASERLIKLAKKGYKPDITAGLRYTLVGRRRDPAGEAVPPEDNGKDVLGLFAGINLPVHRAKLAAGVEEATQERLAAEASKRAVIARIEGNLGDLTHRLDSTWQQLRLFEDVLSVQAEASLRSAEAGYTAGTLNALDLLDAERVLLQVRIATERSRADFAEAQARLEGVIGAPLSQAMENER